MSLAHVPIQTRLPLWKQRCGFCLTGTRHLTLSLYPPWKKVGQKP